MGSNAIFSTQPAFYSELFATPVRYSGIVLVRELPTALVGGTAPFVATALLAWSGGDPWPIAAYMSVTALVGLVCVYLLPETFRKDLSEVQPEERPAVVAAEPD